MIKFFTRLFLSIAGLLFIVALHAQTNTITPTGSIKLHGIIGPSTIVKPDQKPLALMVADVSAERIRKECTFFSGDSLKDFDFENAKKESELHGIKMYSEFLGFMFLHQAEFVKKKYHISALPFEINASNQKINPPVVITAACNNLNFEDGNFGGWTTARGYNANSNAQLTVMASPANLNIDQGVRTCDDLNIISAAFGNDPYGGFPGKDPAGGTYSARVGGLDLNSAAGVPVLLCDGVKYMTNGINIPSNSNGQQLSQTFVVTAANALISFDYAVILNDGGHLNGEQPYFHVYVTDAGGVVLNPTCTEYYVQATAGVPPPGFVNTGFTNPQGDLTILYGLNWVDNSINLTPYIGQTVTLKFMAAGCIYGGHMAYAYIDVTCGPVDIDISPANPCAGGTSILTAPAVQGGTYSWSGPGIVGASNAQSATVNASGTYSVTVTPSQGVTCAYTLSTPITFSSVSAPISTSTNINCNGGNNGSATVNPSGGNPSYTYAWSPSGGNAATANGLTAGTYTVLVTDAGGCTKTQTVSITQPAVLSTTATSTATGCTVPNGTASVNTSGGTANYTYAWSSIGQNTQTATGLAAGNYSIVVTDSKGCTSTKTVTVANTAAPTISVSSTSAGCSVANGTATASGAGGTGTYTYIWGIGQTAQTATGLASGNYTVTVIDSNGCTRTGTVSVAGTNAPTITTTSSTIAGCSVANGTATANATGGTPGYTYNWLPGGQTDQTATGLSGGNYTVTISDMNGCSVVATVSVSITTVPTTTTTVSQASCGNNNGSATANPTGGSPGYTYSWNNGQTTQTATGLTAGLYTVTITDANGCTTSDVANISNANGPIATSSVTANVSCFGGNSGSATTNPSGGTPGYTYLWSNGQTTQTATGLVSGNYTVTVTDANGCPVIATAVISQPSILSATTSQTSILCNGGTASVSITPAGGTPNYTYNWNNGQTAQTATGLVSGNYSVIVTDANGCPVIATAVISQPSILSATTSQTSILCNGGTASASVTPAGGTPAYTYNWSSGQTTSAATPLSNGNYTVLVTDANGCTLSNIFTFTQPALLTSTATQTAILCNGGSGNASVITAGGTPNYTYNWSSGQTTSAIAGIGAGSYSVTITDANGCTSQAATSLIQPTALLLSVSGNDSICAGDTAVLSASSSGGTPNYTYTWIPGPQNGQSISVSPASSTTYSVITSDANGCTSMMQTFSVALFPNPNALFDTLSNGLYGSVYSFGDQSTGSTSWYWTFGDGSSSTLQNPIHTFPGAGTYTVTQIVYNQFGCPDTFKLVIFFEDGILIPNVFTPDGDGINDVWYIPNSGLREFHVDIYDRWGLKVFETTADEIRWDGYSSAGKLLSDGTYYYVLKAILKSFNGDKDYSTKGHVTLLTSKRK